MDINEVDFFDEDEVTYTESEQNADENGGEGGQVIDTSQTETQTEAQTQNENQTQDDGSVTDDIITAYLKYNKIDPEKVKFEDEDGIIRERNWNELSREEQMNILTTSHDEPERELSEDEIKLINDIRTRNISPEQYINIIRQQAAQDYADSLNANPQYRVDDLTDDDVFMLDLQDKIPDITDEEMAEALNKAKENESLFTKQVAGLRKSLKEQEERYLEQQAAEQEAAEEEALNQFKDSVVRNIQSLNKIGDLDVNLEQEDMEDIASFILDRDDTGMSYMGKALNDPKTLVEMAWWTLKGREVLNSISEYFSNEIKNVRQQSYQKGLEDGKKNNTSKVVYKPQTTAVNANATTIDDLYG